MVNHMIETNKIIVIDIDGTICTSPNVSGDYINAQPYLPMIEKLKLLKLEGFYIVLQTSRQMRTYKGNVGKITANTLPTLIDWLKKYKVPYDEIHIGKPWCGYDGYYVDDKAIRPSEFLSKSHEELNALLSEEKDNLKKLIEE